MHVDGWAKKSRTVLGVLLCAAAAAPCSGSSVEHRHITVAGVAVDVVTVNLNSASVRLGVQLAYGSPGAAEGFGAMVKRSAPVAAVNGTHFRRMTLKPVGDIVIAGQQRNFGGMGTAMTVIAGNRVAFRRLQWGKRRNWSDHETVLAAGPMLLTEGKADVRSDAEGYTDPHVTGRVPRTAVGRTRDNRLVLACVGEAISLNKLAETMRDLGCVEAMALGGDASTAMLYRGRVIHEPAHGLTNVLLIYENPRRDQLAYLSAPGQRPSVVGESAWEHYEQGRRELDAGSTGAAAEQFRFAADLDPLNASYHRALADAYSQLGAVTGESSARRAAGACYNSKGLYNEAILHYEAALALDPADIEALRGLSGAYEGLGMAGRASDYRLMAENAAFELASTPPPVAPPPLTRLVGEVEDNTYIDTKAGFEWDIPSGWERIDTISPAAVQMRSRTKPHVAVLHVLALAAPVSLPGYAETFAIRSFKRRLDARDSTLGGRTAYEVLYEEFVIDQLVRSRYVFAATDQRLFILACSAPAEHYGAASEDLERVIAGLRFTD
jgi:tetratricopeptide (TPR) repeat protein